MAPYNNDGFDTGGTGVAPTTRPVKTRRWLSRMYWPRQWRWRLVVIAIGVIIVVLLAVWWRAAHRQAPVTQPASAVSAEFKKQLPSLEKAVKQHPNDAEAHKNYAVALYATGDPKGASKEYETAVKLNPKDALAYNNLGNAYRDLHETNKAIDAYRQSIKLNDKSLNTYANLANVQLYTQNKPADAIATYQAGLQALPNNAQLEMLLGIAYEADGDTAKAKQTYQDILSRDSTNAAAKANLDRLNDR